MNAIALSGNDTIMVNNRILSDFADGNYAELTFPNDIAAVKTGKNGNSIYAFNATGKQSELVIRIIRGTGDDKFLNNLLAQQQSNFSGTVLMIGELIKKLGDGAGNILNDTYLMSGGVFNKQVMVRSNAEGDTEQSVAIYNIRFSNSPRILT